MVFVMDISWAGGWRCYYSIMNQTVENIAYYLEHRMVYCCKMRSRGKQ